MKHPKCLNCARGPCIAHGHGWYTRSDLVRAIVGQQWAVAIALYNPRGNSKETIPHRQMENYGGDWVQMSAEDLASLPCAVDVVEGKEKP